MTKSPSITHPQPGIRLLLVALLLAALPAWAAKPIDAKSPDGKSPTKAPVSATKPAPPVVPATPLTYDPRYFYTVDLDAWYQIVGTGALTPEAAALANCYRFTYDRNGRVVEIEYRRAGVPAPDPLFGAARIDFEESPGLQRRWYRDGHGQTIGNLDGIQGEELALNSAGYPVSVTNLNGSGGKTRDGSGVIRYDRTLDSAGRLVSGRRIGWLGTAITDENGCFETRTAYDNQSRRIEYANFDSSGMPLNNSDGIAVVRTTYVLYPDTMETVKSFFDASGIAVPDKETGAHELEQVFDSRGFLTRLAYFDQTGAPTVDRHDEVHEVRYAYDERGNRTSEEFFDTDGKPRDRKGLGFARVVYQYDDKNRVVEKAYFGDDGTPQVVPDVGAAVVRQDYDAAGNIVRLQFFDGQGHPSTSARYGATAIRIEVDDDRTIIRLRDANDQPVANALGGFYAFSYKTKKDHPLSPFNHYYDRRMRTLSYFPRVAVINPHLYAMSFNPVMQNSARYGATAVGIGSLLACFLALRKSSYARRRKVYIPSAPERFLGWLAVFAILEGTLRFFITVYWSWVDHQNGRMGATVYLVEAFIVVYYVYRLVRQRVTMRVLNIEREQIHRLVREFLISAHLDPKWVEMSQSYVTDPLRVRINYFRQKCHAYLAFSMIENRPLVRRLSAHIREQAATIQAPPRSRAIALYYPSVALCYFLLAGTAFYTLWQLVKSY